VTASPSPPTSTPERLTLRARPTLDLNRVVVHVVTTPPVAGGTVSYYVVKRREPTRRLAEVGASQTDGSGRIHQVLFIPGGARDVTLVATLAATASTTDAHAATHTHVLRRAVRRSRPTSTAASRGELPAMMLPGQRFSAFG
jgi:hypothetical protein